MKQKEPEAAPRVCGRCHGAGVVSTATAEDYYVEDSTVREVPVSICPECLGTGTEDE